MSRQPHPLCGLHGMNKPSKRADNHPSEKPPEQSGTGAAVGKNQPIEEFGAMTSTQASSAAPRSAFWLALAAMSFIVVLSNWAVLQAAPWIDALFGQPDFTFNYGQFTFPLAFLVTDIVNRLFGASMARRLAGAAFVVAVPSSIVINGMFPFPEDPTPWISAVRVGLASGTAFIVGQLLDISVFQRLRNMAWWLAPFIGSVIASVIDTAIFYSIAFYGQDWVVRAGTVDFIVKVAVALVALVPFRLAIASAMPAKSAAN